MNQGKIEDQDQDVNHWTKSDSDSKAEEAQVHPGNYYRAGTPEQQCQEMSEHPDRSVDEGEVVLVPHKLPAAAMAISEPLR